MATRATSQWDAEIWTQAEMIEATVDYWDDDEIATGDCRVVRSDRDGEPCLIVRHDQTGRTSDEAGNGGRWHLDGRAFVA